MLQPNLKITGLLVLIPGLILGYLTYLQHFELAFLAVTKNQNLTDEIALTCIILGLFMIALSKEKKEDEYIKLLRHDAWLWAVTANFALLLFATWIFYDDAFFDVLVYNTFSIPVLFLVRFNWLLNRAKREN